MNKQKKMTKIENLCDSKKKKKKKKKNIFFLIIKKFI